MNPLESLHDALTSALYTEFLLCKDLPLQIREEEIVRLREAALVGKRIEEVKALKEQRAALGYKSSGVSAADMRTRLIALLDQIEYRYSELAALDDDDGCEICVEHERTIKNILAANPPSLLVPTRSRACSISPALPTTPTSPVERAPAVGAKSGLGFLPSCASADADESLAIDSVVLLRGISEGVKSSGKSIVADGVFTAAHATNGTAVKVKIFTHAHLKRAKHEYKMMTKLYQRAPQHFVRPYGFLEGSRGQIIPHLPKDKAFCAGGLCLVMEKGSSDMHDFFTTYQHIDRTERMAIGSTFLDILVFAAQSGTVLNDFKLANIIRVDDGCYYRLKSIDFESSRDEGQEMTAEVTAAYASPEVAREIIARSNKEAPTRLLASHKMDVMALGFLIFEVANNLKSFWHCQIPPVTEHWSILNALVHLTDETTQLCIDKTFPGTQHNALRGWLAHALRVNPKDRASALELRHGHSLFGNKALTVDLEGLIGRMDRGFDRVIANSDTNAVAILESIEELSAHLQSGLEKLGESFDCIAAHAALGSQVQSEEIAALVQTVAKQMHLLESGELDEEALHAAVVSAISHMEAPVRANIGTSLQDVIKAPGPSMNEKMDLLMDMVSGLQSQSERFAEEFQLFRSVSEDHSRMLSLLEERGNTMPLTFIVLPHLEESNAKLPPSSTIFAKMKNCVKRSMDTVTHLIWDKSRIVFMCPVTMKQVPATHLGAQSSAH
jgi:Protein kinase domain